MKKSEKNIASGLSIGPVSYTHLPSGSGKSTLLNVIGGLETIDSGEIIINGIDISKLNPKELKMCIRDSCMHF